MFCSVISQILNEFPTLPQSLLLYIKPLKLLLNDTRSLFLFRVPDSFIHDSILPRRSDWMEHLHKIVLKYVVLIITPSLYRNVNRPLEKHGVHWRYCIQCGLADRCVLLVDPEFVHWLPVAQFEFVQPRPAVEWAERVNKALSVWVVCHRCDSRAI